MSTNKFVCLSYFLFSVLFIQSTILASPIQKKESLINFDSAKNESDGKTERATDWSDAGFELGLRLGWMVLVVVAALIFLLCCKCLDKCKCCNEKPIPDYYYPRRVNRVPMEPEQQNQPTSEPRNDVEPPPSYDETNIVNNQQPVSNPEDDTPPPPSYNEALVVPRLVTAGETSA